jgi:hypothetical protein
MPAYLRGQINVLGIDLGIYRLFLIAVVALVTTALYLIIERTRFGSQIRASVDNQAASAGLGINVNRVFGLTFALGSGLAGLGGALGIEVLGSSRRFRSSTWCTSCSSSLSAARARSKGRSSRARARRLRRRRQVLRARGRRVRHLRADGRAADHLSRGSYGARMSAFRTPMRARREHAALVADRSLASARDRVLAVCRSPRISPVPGYLVLGSQILIVGLFALRSI